MLDNKIKNSTEEYSAIGDFQRIPCKVKIANENGRKRGEREREGHMKHKEQQSKSQQMIYNFDFGREEEQ
jgi:hypothetical protein